MLSGVQPCFQLLRIGSSSCGGDGSRDLYTFRPTLSRCVFRLGRAAELCDVTLEAAAVSRIHAELHAERDEREDRGGQHLEEGWRVHVKDRSSHGTWVNEVRLQPGVLWELSDSDTLAFGGQSEPGGPEFYFLFQKVKVRPLDFDAITIPKAGTFSSDLQNRIRTSLERKATGANLDLSKLSINRATVILNSIGSLSKMKGSAWTFQRSHSLEGCVSDPGSSSSPPPPPLSVGFSSSSALLPPSTPPSFSSSSSVALSSSVPKALSKGLQTTSRSRRKSAHTVLLEDDSSDEPRSRGAPSGCVEDGQRARAKKRRRLYKSESESFSCTPPPPPPAAAAAASVPLQLKPQCSPAARPATAPRPPSHQRPFPPSHQKPFPVGIRTIGSFHGAMTNSRLNHHLLQQASLGNNNNNNTALHSKQEAQQQQKMMMHRVQTVTHGNIAAFRHQLKQTGGGHSSHSSHSSHSGHSSHSSSSQQAAGQRGRRRAHSSPVFSPLVVGGENYSLASPSVRICTEDRNRLAFNRLHHPTSKRRGRPRKHPLPPRPSLPSPSSSSSSSTSSASSSSGSSSSSSSSDDDDDVTQEGEGEGSVTGGATEPCAAPRCRLPQQDTVQWIQCDVCDAWFHLDCLHVDRKKLLKDPSAEFHCGCC